MNPGDLVVWNHPQHGRLTVKVMRKAPNLDAYMVQYERGRGIVNALAQARHLEPTAPQSPPEQSSGHARLSEAEFDKLVCPCGDPQDCAACK